LSTRPIEEKPERKLQATTEVEESRGEEEKVSRLVMISGVVG
jgi:hypothetical protein